MEKKKILYMTELGILTAILILMQFTPIGYLRIGIVSITFMAIPVSVGAIVLGPLAGVILGAVFGITSLIQCFMGDAFGIALLSIDPALTAILCIVPRVLVGLASAYVFKLFKNKKGILSYAVSALSASVVNTVGFIFGLTFLFGNTEFIGGLIDTMGGGNIFVFFIAFATFNAVIEAIACCLVGGTLSKVTYKAVNAKYLF
ncbi:MAG: ECF transporter S component [Clostridia bacterium]